MDASPALLYRGRYRVPSARCGAWAYAAPGAYFVTWCTAGRAPALGRVGPDGALVPSALGRVVATQIAALPGRRAGVSVEAFVAMPDHVHALLALDTDVWLGAIVRHLKSGSTRDARRAGLWGIGPLWQGRFHDRIVRNGREHAAIVRYIADNPMRWALREARIERP